MKDDEHASAPSMSSSDPAPTKVGTATNTDDHSTVTIAEDDMAACLRVLEQFHAPDGLAAFQQPRFKPLRKALMPLMADLRSKFFGGDSADNDSRRQERKRKRKIEQARQKALDETFINNTKLRAERLAKLAALTAENPLLAQVPDGAIADHRLLADAPAEQPKEAADASMDGANDDQVTTTAEAAVDGDVESKLLNRPRACYTCKTKFRQLHHFYDRMCPKCAALNFQKRLQTADLRDHVAIVTGARVKIGYEIALKLLRSGATVIATTRFPKDAALRYAQETDFEEWKHRLEVYGMDFRDLGVIEKFMDHVDRKFGKLDILINNATQTIRRPTHYYKHLLESESAPMTEDVAAKIQPLLRSNAKLLGASTDASLGVAAPAAQGSVAVTAASTAGVSSSVLLSQVALLPEDHESADTSALFPTQQYDVNNQQVDLRKSNSWVQKINEIETMELVEVFAINAMAPFILNKRAIPLLEKSNQPRKFIINVSAMEGKFYRAKTPNHPHTNMAKAAVNMMTRTCAEDLAKRGIFMNSVDTGWINDENPRDIAVNIAKKHNFQTPLDEIDAAARVVDPIFALHQPDNANTPPVFGQFLKDYMVTEW